MAEAPLRLFVAVPVSPEALDACRTLIEGVRQDPRGARARWVRTDNLHLTLRFLGAAAPERVDGIAEAVRAAADGRASFRVSLAGAGAFPTPARPRALWLGIEEGHAELATISSALDTSLAALGWPPEPRPFRPHLTIARTDAASIADAARVGAALVAAAAGWRTTFIADRVVLYRSHLRSGPPVYEPLAEVALAATAR